MDKIDYEGIISENEVLLSVREYTVEAMKSAVAAAIPIVLQYAAEKGKFQYNKIGVMTKIYVDKESITSLESELIKQLAE